jgi:hypothetical protein
MIKTQTIVSGIRNDETFEEDEHADDEYAHPYRKSLRGHRMSMREMTSLQELTEEEAEDLINSQMTHRVNKIRTKSGHTPAQLKDPSSADAYLQLKRSATNNFLKESYRFQPHILEKPL